MLFLFCNDGRGQYSYSLYLIGDAGEPTIKDAPYKDMLAAQLAAAKGKESVVFLGDNIYPKGMPGADAPSRAASERILTDQISLAGNGVAPIYFVPGNHDWKQGRKDGFSYLRNQERWIDSLNKDFVHFLPEGGCPGPVEISLTPALTLVIIDSQWFFHQWEKPAGHESPCEAKTPSDVLAQLDDILRRNAGKRVVVVAHHPVYTYGEHGGEFTLREHLFPLTDFNKRMWIPLPVLGSIYPFYRKVFGNIQDVAHPVYQDFRNGLTQLFHQYPGTIYAAGHEHTLQYSWKDSIHYVVSGAGSKATPVKKKRNSRFAFSGQGYARLNVREDGSALLEYFSGNAVVFSTEIPAVHHDSRNTGARNKISEGSVRAVASKRYNASQSHEKWLGKNYRDVWGKAIAAPVFDIGTEHGGLKIVQRGGGFQTLSLRLQDSAGREYTLRSIEKYPAKAIPAPFRKTFAEDLVQDQISASHPYGAVVVPRLAQAAGIYHTNPKIVFIPDDQRLGVYQRDFSNQLMLFEERPSGGGEGRSFFGDADKIIGIDKLVEKLTKDNANHIDQEFVLRSRLFDLLIGDWDRHDDQWRWAEFDEKKGKLYRPIPRDRDQAFFVNEGRLPPVWSRRWLLPKFEGFRDSIRWTPGLAFNARYFDRCFLTGLSRQQWMEAAHELTRRVTDGAIDSALRALPDDVSDMRTAEIARRLKSRRDRMEKYAVELYLFLAKEVDITGSDKSELFEITRAPDGNVLVEVFRRTKKDGKGKKIYGRDFISSETREVRLYGLGGDDRFVFQGGNRSGIKVRVIGGSGKDSVASTAKQGDNFIYDVKGDVAAEGGGLHDRTSRDASVNTYDRLAFRYNQTAPLVTANYNIDDGVFLGGGALITTQGFRKNPFKAQHFILGSYAFNTGSFNVRYDGRFTHVFGKWNLELDADIKSPNYVNNFFGFGNQSVYNQKINKQPGINIDDAIQFYRIRFKEYAFEAKVARNFGQAGFLRIGPAFQHVEIVDPGSTPRFIKQYAAELNEKLFETGRSFGGIAYGWGFDKRDNKIQPSRGLFFQQNSRWMAGISSQAQNFSSHQVSLALYETVRLPSPLTFAFRAAAGRTFGNYQLYQAQILDGRTEIRGFRKTRFYGDSKLVFNNEVRLKLASFRSYLFPASLGLTGFYDVGRVWYKDSNGADPTAPNGKSTMWHKGIGGGIWFTPFGLAVITVEVAHSEEETLGYLRMGFLF